MIAAKLYMPQMQKRYAAQNGACETRQKGETQAFLLADDLRTATITACTILTEF